jgi:hypothetical protein
MVDSNGNYAYKKNGSMISTDFEVTVGDGVLIGKFLGSFIYQLHRGTETYNFYGDSVNSVQGMGNNKTYFGIKVGNDTGKIAFSGLATTISPFAETLSTGVYTENKTVSRVIRNSNLIKVSASDVSLTLPTPGVRNLLGFNKSFYTDNVVSGAFNAENPISINSFNNDLVVEVSQLNVNTYDHTYKQLRNIIMVVTSGEVKKSITAKGSESFELSYTDAFPTYLNLGNLQTTLQIPQLSVRVTSEGSILPMNGKMSCLFLFKDETDNY